MHGCSLAFGFPVNAEVDSMGGVVEAGDGVGTRPSPRRAAIEKVHADLRKEYDFREDKRRELDFLEKGGDPLDFKFGNAASTSVQSTSLKDQLPELLVTSEAKDSIAFTASTHGDSVESSGAPGAQSALEPISADNLMLFDGDTDSIEGGRVPKQPKKSNFALADHSFNLDGSQNEKYIGDSGAVGLARIAYNRRRYRSRPGRHAGRSSSSDMAPAQGIKGSSLHSFGGHRDFEGLVSDRGQNQKVSSNGDLKPRSPVSSAVCQTAPSNTQMDSGLGIVKAVESANVSSKDDPVNDPKDSEAMQNLHDDPHNLDSSCGVHKYPRTQSLEEPHAFRASEEVAVEGLEFRPVVPVTVIQTHVSSGHLNGSSFANVDVKITPNGSMTNNIGHDSNVLESMSSCTQARLSLDGSNDIGVQTNGICLDASGSILVSALGSDETIQADHMRKETDGTRADEKKEPVIGECGAFKESLKENGFLLKAEEDTNANVSGFEDEVENHTQNKFNGQSMVESMDVDSCGAGRDTDVPSVVNMDPECENVCKVGPEVSSGPSIEKLPKSEPPTEISNNATVKLTLSATDLKARRADEDLILEEARIIEAKRRRMAQSSLSNTSVHFHSRSHWDFVLEEMAWLANDFAQERLWKISAASQVGHWVSLLSRMRFHEKKGIMESRKKAQFLARSVMEFWHAPVRKSQGTEPPQSCSRDCSPALREYALRFRKNCSFEVRNVEVQAPVTPDRASDVAAMDTSLGDHSQEEKLLYVVPPDAMDRYRNYVESYTANYEKTGSGRPEEFEISTSDTVADNVYEEDEAETSTYDLYVPLDSSKSSNYSQKQLKNSTRAYGARNLEVVADSPSMQCVDNQVRSQQPVLMGKRPANSLNVSFPTKRVRSSNRPRVLCSFTAGTSAYVQGTTKPDALSGDNNYFQDDQSTFDGVSPALDNLAVESVGDFEKPLGYESAEVSTQMKRKKARHLGTAYERRWQDDSNFQSDQREDSNKRLDCHQFESNGSSGGLFGHHVTKKLKVIKQSVENAIDSSALLGRSAPSAVASQISNPNKFAKFFGGRDRARKTKLLKIPSGQPGPGSPWSLFEEQALVVLVHDLGQNWELVSDAINSTLQFKCIFRNPKECKDRHKQLMDRTSGDGADSADDSGSSQAYSSTLPGIPKGSARQLFQRLQGPMEEDTVKSHFEKIIMIGQKLHGRRKQEPKQIQPPHGSHMVALNQVYPNNLNGVPILTPLDLCDATGSGSDVLPLTYPGAHSGALPAPNQGVMTPMLPASGANSPAVGSFNMAAGNNFSSPPVPANASLRDARHVTSKSASLVIEEQKTQQYNQMLAGRNVSQSSLPSSGPLPANDRGVRMLPGSNGVTISGGGNRSLPTAYQGIAGVKMPSPANIHPGVGCVQGNPSRPLEALHMIREPQHQVKSPELQMQVSQGSNQGIFPYGALSSSFPNQTASLPVPPHPLHHQQPHTMPPQQLHSISPRHPHVHGNNHTPNLQHQAYAIRLAKDRQMQQRHLQLQQQRQQQHFPPHNSLMPHAQSQAQLPISSPKHNSSQVSSQSTPLVTVSSSTPGSPMTAVPQHEQQHQMMPHGFAKNAQAANSSMTNQMGKQRRRQGHQQFTQSGRHHPQQRQQVHSQQQAKVLNRLGQGNAVHQNMVMEASGVNSPSVNTGNHSAENGEQPIHLLQGRGLYSTSAKNPVSAGKPLGRQSSNQSQPVQRLAGNQHSQLAGRPKFVNQSQLSVEKVLQQNHPLNSDSTMLLLGREPQSDQISSQRGTIPTSSRASNDITNVPKVISPASTTPWGGSESTCDSGSSSATAHLGASGTPAFTESSSQVVQGSGERHSSDNLPSEEHDVGIQWEQKPAHLQQQQESSQQQSLPLSVSQPQTQLTGSMYVRPPDSMLE